MHLSYVAQGRAAVETSYNHCLLLYIHLFVSPSITLTPVLRVLCGIKLFRGMVHLTQSGDQGPGLPDRFFMLTYYNFFFFYYG